MALTAEEVVNRGLRKLGAIAVQETADSTELARGLEALNDMMFGWLQRGVDVEHVALTASDPVQLDNEWNSTLAALSAEYFAPIFELELSDANKREAMEAWNALYAAFGAPTEVAFDTTLTVMPSRFQRSGGFWS